MPWNVRGHRPAFETENGSPCPAHSPQLTAKVMPNAIPKVIPQSLDLEVAQPRIFRQPSRPHPARAERPRSAHRHLCSSGSLPFKVTSVASAAYRHIADIGRGLRTVGADRTPLGGAEAGQGRQSPRRWRRSCPPRVRTRASGEGRAQLEEGFLAPTFPASRCHTGQPWWTRPQSPRPIWTKTTTTPTAARPALLSRGETATRTRQACQPPQEAEPTSRIGATTAQVLATWATPSAT